MSQDCPSCGAGNPASALWCNQCFASFQSQTVAQPEPPPTIAEPEPPPAIAEPVASSVVTAEPTEAAAANWECQVCGGSNLVADNMCATCGTSIFEVFGSDRDEIPDIEPRTAMLWAMIPGVGHARAGNGVLGLTIATVVLFCGGAAVTLAGTSQTVAAVFYGLACLSVWGISIVDAGSVASGREPLLHGRRITILAGLLVTVIIIQVISQLGQI